MKQELIKALLEEASKPDCTWDRRNRIQCDLTEAIVPLPDEDKGEGWNAWGYHALANALFQDTIRNRPDLLPSLFPVFAIICGDRKDETWAHTDVDWSLVDAK